MTVNYKEFKYFSFLYKFIIIIIYRNFIQLVPMYFLDPAAWTSLYLLRCFQS